MMWTGQVQVGPGWSSTPAAPSYKKFPKRTSPRTTATRPATICSRAAVAGVRAPRKSTPAVAGSRASGPSSTDRRRFARRPGRPGGAGTARSRGPCAGGAAPASVSPARTAAWSARRGRRRSASGGHGRSQRRAAARRERRGGHGGVAVAAATTAIVAARPTIDGRARRRSAARPSARRGPRCGASITRRARRLPSPRGRRRTRGSLRARPARRRGQRVAVVERGDEPRDGGGRSHDGEQPIGARTQPRQHGGGAGEHRRRRQRGCHRRSRRRERRASGEADDAPTAAEPARRDRSQTSLATSTDAAGRLTEDAACPSAAPATAVTGVPLGVGPDAAGVVGPAVVGGVGRACAANPSCQSGRSPADPARRANVAGSMWPCSPSSSSSTPADDERRREPPCRRRARAGQAQRPEVVGRVERPARPTGRPGRPSGRGASMPATMSSMNGRRSG